AGVAATLVLFLAGWAVTAASAVANVEFGQRLSYDLAGDLFAHLQRLSLGFHRHKATGDTIRRVTTDSGAVATIVKDALLPAASSLVTVAAMVVVLWRLDPVLSLGALVVLPVAALALRRWAGPLLRAGERVQEADGRVYDAVEETFSAIPVVQAFAREDDV